MKSHGRIEIVARARYRPGWGPILLISIAIAQWLVSATWSTSPWIGGGYGMFATVDGNDRKAMMVDRTGAAHQIHDEALRQAPFPWVLEHRRAQLDAVEVFVARPTFDVESGTVTWELVATTEPDS